MPILAIDPGYERLGIAVLEKEKVLFSDCFRTSAKLSFEERLCLLGKEVESTIKKFKPTALVIENLFLGNNQKTAMRVAEVRGAIIFICIKAGLSIKELTPMQIKMAVTGNGRSTKDQVIKMIHLLVPNFKKGALDDEYDAVAAGLAYISYNKSYK